MTRAGSENVSDRRQVVVQDAARDKDAGRAIRIGRDAVELSRDLQSDNYEPGQSGWRLNRATGDLEANSGTFRGDLDAAGGTFSGDLSAAGGSFSGNLSAAGGTFSGTVTVSSFSSGAWHRLQVTGGRTLVRRGNTIVGSILAQTDDSGNTDGFFTLGYGLQDFSSPSGNRVQMTSNGVFMGSGIYGVGVSGNETNINGVARVNGSTIRTFSNTTVPSGSRTTDSINWIGATGGPNGSTGREDPRNTVAHTHEVQFHTHTITI